MIIEPRTTKFALAEGAAAAVALPLAFGGGVGAVAFVDEAVSSKRSTGRAELAQALAEAQGAGIVLGTVVLMASTAATAPGLAVAAAMGVAHHPAAQTVAVRSLATGVVSGSVLTAAIASD